MDSDTGQMRNLVEDPDVEWTVGLRVNWGDHALDRVRKELQKEDDRGHVSPYLKNPTKTGEFWTIEEWLSHADDDDKPIEQGAPRGGRAPTAAERAKMRAEKEARIAAVLAQAEDQ